LNRGSQAQGDQQRALVGSIVAYATLVVTDAEQLAARGGAVTAAL
jgi:hemoglobin-like flavoprotein